MQITDKQLKLFTMLTATRSDAPVDVRYGPDGSLLLVPHGKPTTVLEPGEEHWIAPEALALETPEWYKNTRAMLYVLAQNPGVLAKYSTLATLDGPSTTRILFGDMITVVTQKRLPVDVRQRIVDWIWDTFHANARNRGEAAAAFVGIVGGYSSVGRDTPWNELCRFATYDRALKTLRSAIYTLDRMVGTTRAPDRDGRVVELMKEFGVEDLTREYHAAVEMFHGYVTYESDGLAKAAGNFQLALEAVDLAGGKAHLPTLMQIQGAGKHVAFWNFRSAVNTFVYSLTTRQRHYEAISNKLPNDKVKQILDDVMASYLKKVSRRARQAR